MYPRATSSWRWRRCSALTGRPARPGCGMPVDAITRDLANRSLVKIRIEDVPEGHLVMAMAAVFRADRPPGPAGLWDAGGRDYARSGKSIAGENPDRGCTRGPPRHGDGGGVPR